MRVEENIKVKDLEFKAALRRAKDIAVRLRDPKRLGDYFGVLAANRVQLRSLVNLFPLDPALKNDKAAFFGHFDQLHERITGRKGSFRGAVDTAKEAFSRKGNTPYQIGVSRYNFFCLDQIAEFVLSLKGVNDVRFPSFDIFPLERIIHNFIDYAGKIREKTKEFNLDFMLVDEQFVEIMQVVQFHAQRGKVSDKGLARLFGIIAEAAFVGPQTIVFDPFHRCNLKCRHCFVHNPLIHHQEEFLNRKFDYAMFQRIIDDAAELQTDGIILQGDGEPLLHDKFFPMIKYARSKNLGVSFFTNGSLIGKKEAQEIVDLGVQEIYCSLPAGTPKTYELVTANGTAGMFNATIDNLRNLIELRKEAGAARPRLIMTHVIHALNCHELLEMAKTDASIGTDASRFYLIRLDENNKALKLSPKQLAAIKNDLPACRLIFKERNIDFIDNIFFQLDHYDETTGAWSKEIFSREGCTVGWYFCLIPALYDVSMCCHLRTTGYLNRQSFKDLWNSREYRSYRIKAKYLGENRDFVFPNGVRIYDEHCEHCDNHQTLLSNLEELHKLGLYKYLKG